MNQRVHTESSIPQIVSNLRMFLNFDQSDAQSIMARLYQGTTQNHRYATPKMVEDKITVNKVLNSEKLGKDFEAYYDLLENQGNPDLLTAVLLLRKLLSTSKGVRQYLEARTEIFIQRVTKSSPRYISSKSITNPAKPKMDHSIALTQEELYSRSTSLPHTPGLNARSQPQRHVPVEIKSPRETSDQRREPRGKIEPRKGTPEILEHKREIRGHFDHRRERNDNLEPRKDTRDYLEPREHDILEPRTRDNLEQGRERSDIFDQRREPRDSPNQRREPREVLEPPKQSKSPKKHSPDMITRSYLTRNYVNPSADTLLKNPPPPMREVDLFSQERLIVEEIISLLIGVQGWYILYDPDTKQLGYYQGGEYINPSLRSLIRKIEPLFCFYSTVTKFIEMYSTYEHGLVSQSLCSVMSTLLKEHFTVAAQLETQLRSGNLSIQQLWFFLQPCFKTLSLLYEICEDIEKSKMDGATILSMLYNKMSTFIGDPKAKQWCLALATHTSVPYFEILENWIYRGIILDPKQEFMVEESKTTPNPALHSHPYYDLTTHYWDRTYTWKREKTPCFLENLPDKILKTGKYLNVFRESEKKLNNPNRINIRYSENPRDYIEPIDLAFKFASEQLLWELSRDHDLMGRLNALRRYFLMNQGDFFLHFMSIARTELFGTAEDIQLQRLQGLLEVSITNSNARFDKYADYLKVKLETSDVVDMLALVIRIDKQIPDKRIKSDAFEFLPKPGEYQSETNLSGLEAFDLEFEVKWPVSLVISAKVMTYYQLLFRQLFYFKHVETSLNEAWIRQKNMKQYQLIGQVPAYTKALVLRQQMISYVQNFQFYMMYEVIQLNWKHFQQKYDRASTVDDVMQAHMDFLEKCVNDFLMHHHDIIRTVWKILALCVQFTNYLNLLAADFNQKFQTYLKSNDIRNTYKEAAAKNVLRKMVEGDFDQVIRGQQKQFTGMLDQFIDRVSRLTHETDPDHKTNSLIVRLKFYTRISSTIFSIK
ncbi:Gamma-tubulin complex component 2 [Oopsacas minuta]|uniref:Gamma-tubulin complex component n=1 Tax=Oopsacas minuta TaxID=111878 RepID=A0AAV7K5T2_9METZ|nr:Gamma-tubulin complex component 2 [Oopsacas minuta]